jgi:hypothetical protein
MNYHIDGFLPKYWNAKEIHSYLSRQFSIHTPTLLQSLSWDGGYEIYICIMDHTSKKRTYKLF